MKINHMSTTSYLLTDLIDPSPTPKAAEWAIERTAKISHRSASR